MENSELIAAIKRLSKKSGWKPSTFCLRATGNNRLLETLESQDKKNRASATLLRRWAKKNGHLDAFKGE